MQESITQATQDVDLLLYVMDGNKDFADDDINRLKYYCKQGYPVFAVVNKMDLGSFESIYPRIARLNEIEGLQEVYVISAKQGKNIDELKQAIIAKLTDTIEYYPRDIYGAQTLEFNLAELIREKMLWLLNEEIPLAPLFAFTLLNAMFILSFESIFSSSSLVTVLVSISSFEGTARILGTSTLSLVSNLFSCR